MFQTARPSSPLASAMRILALIFHATVRHLRKDHGNAIIGLLTNMMQTVAFVVAFYLVYEWTGLRGASVRGDFMLYIMSGIFLFMTHTKAMGAVVAAEGPASPLMKHAPMNTVVAIAAAALGSLYIQILSMVAVLTVYHLGVTPVVVHRPAGAMGMVLLSWFSGASVGIVFLAVKPWLPGLAKVLTTVYSRVNMIASGKMFVANQMPGHVLAFFAWNPLFHTIDQCRGFVFVNYSPHHSGIAYPLVCSVGLVCLGLVGEFHTRKNASLSWQAKR
jgi:ABC-type polysaccharide/polyol phosphate export permease